MRVYQFRHIRADGQCSPATRLHPSHGHRRSHGGLLRGAPAVLVASGAARGLAPRRGARRRGRRQLDAPPLAQATSHSRALSARRRRAGSTCARPRAALPRAPRRSAAALAEPHRARDPAARASAGATGSSSTASPSSLPTAESRRLAAIPGVAEVYPGVALPHATLDRSLADDRRAAALGRRRSTTRAHGMKIGILDDGVDQTPSVLLAGGLRMPAGFPKGQTDYTTAKVIVARAFAPPVTRRTADATLPFDPAQSEHATHVAGIAAGNADDRRRGGRGPSPASRRARTSATTRC